MVFFFSKAKAIALLSALKPTDEVVLAKDSGVYIMSFAQPTENRTIVYADGHDPETYLGGDDFGDDIGPAGELLKFAKASKNGLMVTLTETTIEVKPF